jgi:hypothetical protein
MFPYSFDVIEPVFTVVGITVVTNSFEMLGWRLAGMTMTILMVELS